MVTGGSSGLGLESAKRLALGGARIVLTTRSDAQGQAAVQAVHKFLEKQQQRSPEYHDSAIIDYKILDLNDLQGVSKSVDSWNDIERVDVLINNAGVMALPDRELTRDGVERQIQVNHLAHFLLTARLAPKLAPQARIVNVSSGAAHDIPRLEFDYLWRAAPSSYSPWRSY